jgi:hypothetical protein
MESNYREIMYNNTKQKILQYLSESDTQFNKRLDYIKSLESTKIKFNEVIRLSNIWMNITMKKCKYNKETYLLVIKK